MKKRWIAVLTTYEPPYKSQKWGRQCIEFQFTDRPCRPSGREIGTIECDPRKACKTQYVEAAERGEITLSPLFTHDMDFREIRPLFGEI